MGLLAGVDSAGARAPEPRRAPATSPGSPWWMLAAAALVLALHARVVGFEFLHFDDPWNIVENPRLQPPTLEGLLAYWSGPYLGLYVPLACSLWWVAAFVGEGPEAWLYHLLPLLAHAGAAALLVRLLQRLGFGGAPALLGAALWSLHPLQVEVVAWASELRGAAANLLAIAYLERGCAARAGGRGALVHAHLALVGALLCKPSAAVAPALALLLESGFPAAGSRTKMQSGCSCTAGNSVANCRLRDQWVVAARPLSRPAPASTMLPLQMLAMRGPERPARASQAMSRASRQAASTPSPPITITRSTSFSWRGRACTGQCTPALLRTAPGVLHTSRQV